MGLALGCLPLIHSTGACFPLPRDEQWKSFISIIIISPCNFLAGGHGPHRFCVVPTGMQSEHSQTASTPPRPVLPPPPSPLRSHSPAQAITFSVRSVPLPLSLSRRKPIRHANYLPSLGPAGLETWIHLNLSEPTAAPIEQRALFIVFAI